MTKRKDENGILEYGNSKQKKLKENIYGYNNYGDKLSLPLSDEQRQAMIDDARIASAQMQNEQQELAAPINEAQKIEQYNNSARSFLVPSPNDELRRRRLFATSDRAMRDAAEEVYQNGLKDTFKKERTAAEQNARNEYLRYASVPGANSDAALGAMQSASAPDKVIARTMHNADDAELNRIASQYASYARMSPQEFRNDILEPRLEQRLYEEYVDEAAPKSSAEYIARSSYNNSLTGKLIDWKRNALAQNNSQSLIDREGLASYDANHFEDLAAGVGSLLVDMPMFSAIGGVSSSAVKGVAGIAKNLSSSLAKKYAVKGMQAPVAERIVEQAIKSRMAAKIAESSATQGLTLGTYDAGNSIADDLLANDGIDIDKAVKAYGKGLATGAAVGLVGTPLRMKSYGLTGGKKMAAAAGVLGAESAVFTAVSGVDKFLSGVDVEPIDLLADFGDSMATLGAMRLAHWRPRGGYAKLNADGKLKKELCFTSAEQKEMMRTGVEPEQFVSQLESALSTPQKETSAHISDLKNKYLQMMSSNELSASTRAKLMFLVENKITSTPPMPVDYRVEKTPEGNYNFSLYDINGRRIDTRENLTDAQIKENLNIVSGSLRKNRISISESELLAEYYSDNFFRQVGKYASDKGMNVDKIIDTIYKSVNNQSTNPEDNALLHEIIQRAGLSDKRVGYLLQKTRRNLEKKYGLDDGYLLQAIDMRTNYISEAANRALDEYLAVIEKEVDALKNGVDPARLRAIDSEMEASDYPGYTNYDAKNEERRRYAEYNMDNGTAPVPARALTGRLKFPIEVPKRWNEPYAWSVYGIKNTPKDFMKLQSRAVQLSTQLGFDVNFIYDERSIPFDGKDVDGYNEKVSAFGWFDNQSGKIYINLPNVRDVHELEKTLVHEAIGHAGLSNLMGKYLYDFYDEIYNRADPTVIREIHKIGQQYGIDGYAAIEEYLATLLERNLLTRKENMLLNDVKNIFKKMLVGKKFYSPDNENITKSDLQDFLDAHQKAMLRKQHPDHYRAQLLGKFPSFAGVTDFYDAVAHNRYLQERYPDKKSALAATPSFLFDQKRKMLEQPDSYGIDDVQDYPLYRLIGKRGANRLAASKQYEDYLKNNAPDGALGNTQEQWASTGWEKGADGRWRTEIGEEQLELRDLAGMVLELKDQRVANIYNAIKGAAGDNPSPKHEDFLNNLCRNYERVFAGTVIKLRHLVDDPLFYTAYPKLADVKVEVTDKIEGTCKYDQMRNVMYVTPQAVFKNSELKHDIVPQLQYMIQIEEGFAPRLDFMELNRSRTVKREYDEAVNMAQTIIKAQEDPALSNTAVRASILFTNHYKMGPEQFLQRYPTGSDYLLGQLFNKPFAQSSDVEAANAYKRQFMTPYERDRNAPSLTEETPRSDQKSFANLAEAMNFLRGPLDELYRYKRYESYGLPGEWANPNYEIKDINIDELLVKARRNPMMYEYFNNIKHRYIKEAAQKALAKYEEVIRRKRAKEDYTSLLLIDPVEAPDATKDPKKNSYVELREAEIFSEIASMPLAKMHFGSKALQGMVPRGQVINELEDRLKVRYGLNDDFDIFGSSYLDDNNH